VCLRQVGAMVLLHNSFPAGAHISRDTAICQCQLCHMKITFHCCACCRSGTVAYVELVAPTLARYHTMKVRPAHSGTSKWLPYKARVTANEHTHVTIPSCDAQSASHVCHAEVRTGLLTPWLPPAQVSHVQPGALYNITNPTGGVIGSRGSSRVLTWRIHGLMSMFCWVSACMYVSESLAVAVLTIVPLCY
jgi:hypothetical protein